VQLTCAMSQKADIELHSQQVFSITNPHTNTIVCDVF
jgi:hypothetical protein